MKAADVMTEAAWSSQVVGIAKQYGWYCFHAPDNKPGAGGRRQTVSKGWPDWVFLGFSRSLFVELKSEKGRVRPEQAEVLRMLSDAGHEVAILRPSDLPLVLRVLGPQQERLHHLPGAA